MLHHNSAYLSTLEQQRLRTAAPRRLPANPDELERVFIAAERGDQTAWAALIGRFRAHVLHVARSHRLSAHAADDVAQETWLRLFNNIGRVRDARALPAWLTTTARRESLRAIESRGREEATDVEVIAELAGGPDLAVHNAENELAEADRRAAVAVALETLPERHRALMRSLVAEPAPSYAEISKELGIPVGSIGPIRGRCVARLRREMELKAAAEAGE